MRLESFDVRGFRSLRDVRGIRLGSPAILTGRNDSGKSAILQALGFLLGERRLGPDDLSSQTPSMLKATEMCVSGLFSLSLTEQSRHQREARIELRRRQVDAQPPLYETLVSVVEDEELRDVDGLVIGKLKNLVVKHGLRAPGRQNERQTFLEPLRAFVASRPTVELWHPASAELVASIPRFVEFSSTDEPDPEREVREVLTVAYSSFVNDKGFSGQITEIEAEVNEELTQKANALKQHILEKSGDLSDITIAPHVRLRPAFSDVSISARREEGGPDVALNAGGAGRKRQITLAIWEWASVLIDDPATPEDHRDVVIAYDEPDTHLDYLRQRELMDLLRNQSLPDHVSMIVATHSLNFIDRVDTGDVMLAGLVDGSTRVESLRSPDDEDLNEFLTFISDSMGIRASTLLHERVFLFVEGATEVRVLPRMFRLVEGLPPQSLGVAIVPCDGNESAIKLGALLRERGRSVFVLLDSDSKTEPNTRRYLKPERLRGLGFTEGTDLFYAGAREIEDLFTDDQWATTANEKWPRDSGLEWDATEFAVLRSGKFSSLTLKLLEAESTFAPRSKPEALGAVVDSIAIAAAVPEPLASIISTISRQ